MKIHTDERSGDCVTRQFILTHENSTPLTVEAYSAEMAFRSQCPFYLDKQATVTDSLTGEIVTLAMLENGDVIQIDHPDDHQGVDGEGGAGA